MSWDVLVLGAGMAGLASARRLAEAGLRVCVVEARERVGGRVRTEWVDGQAVELGAEFLHGLQPELLDLAEEAGLAFVEREGSFAVFAGDRLSLDGADEGDEDRLLPLRELRDFRGPDQSFRTWIEASRWAQNSEVREGATAYVEGFDAADTAEISAASLGVEQRAEDAVEGGRVWHLQGGYARLAEFLAERVRAAGGEIRCSLPVRAVHWNSGRAAFETDAEELAATRAVVTLPLGVLQRGDVRIVPEPEAVLAAARTMRMGEVCRLSLVFHREWWGELEGGRWKELSFILAPGEIPGVWWTAHPEPGAVLTGWVGGPRSRPLLAKTEDELKTLAVRGVARLFGVGEGRVLEELVGFHTHNWSADPWSRGAYSYVGVGGLEQIAVMSAPVEHTLFFAGEHTETTGRWATVHGAVASGYRAASQVLDAVRAGEHVRPRQG